MINSRFFDQKEENDTFTYYNYPRYVNSLILSRLHEKYSKGCCRFFSDYVNLSMIFSFYRDSHFPYFLGNYIIFMNETKYITTSALN